MNDINVSCADWHEKAMGAVLDERSLHLRRRVADVLECSKRGHLGSSLSLIEILRVLYDDILRYDVDEPDAMERDRCILSKGHGCIALYVMLADKGFISEEELRSFCQLDGLLGGHPDATKIPGVEASTGSLGHGLSVGLGMALAARFDRRDSRIFVIAGDGECNEGSIWEACMSAGKHGADNLTFIIDYNKFQSYDATCTVQDLEPLEDKLAAFGWSVRHANGHDATALRRCLSGTPFAPGKPSALICHTVKGKGVPFAENNLQWHHKSSITEEMMRDIRTALG